MTRRGRCNILLSDEHVHKWFPVNEIVTKYFDYYKEITRKWVCECSAVKWVKEREL